MAYAYACDNSADPPALRRGGARPDAGGGRLDLRRGLPRGGCRGPGARRRGRRHGAVLQRLRVHPRGDAGGGQAPAHVRPHRGQPRVPDGGRGDGRRLAVGVGAREGEGGPRRLSRPGRRRPIQLRGLLGRARSVERGHPLDRRLTRRSTTRSTAPSTPRGGRSAAGALHEPEPHHRHRGRRPRPQARGQCGSPRSGHRRGGSRGGGRTASNAEVAAASEALAGAIDAANAYVGRPLRRAVRRCGSRPRAGRRRCTGSTASATRPCARSTRPTSSTARRTRVPWISTLAGSGVPTVASRVGGALDAGIAFLDADEAAVGDWAVAGGSAREESPRRRGDTPRRRGERYGEEGALFAALPRAAGRGR